VFTDALWPARQHDAPASQQTEQQQALQRPGGQQEQERHTQAHPRVSPSAHPASRTSRVLNANAASAMMAERLAEVSAFARECPVWAQLHRVEPLHLMGLDGEQVREMEHSVLRAHVTADAVWAHAPGSTVHSVISTAHTGHAEAVQAADPFRTASPAGTTHKDSAAQRIVRAIAHQAKASGAGANTAAQNLKALAGAIASALRSGAGLSSSAAAAKQVPLLSSLLHAVRDEDGLFMAESHTITQDGSTPNGAVAAPPMTPGTFAAGLNAADLPGLHAAAVTCGPISAETPNQHACSISASVDSGFVLRVNITSGEGSSEDEAASVALLPASGAVFGPMLSLVGLSGPLALASPIHGCTTSAAGASQQTPRLSLTACGGQAGSPRRSPSRSCEVNAAGEAVCEFEHDGQAPVAVVLRGGCSFAEKALAAQSAGAAAVIVLDANPARAVEERERLSPDDEWPELGEERVAAAEDALAGGFVMAADDATPASNANAVTIPAALLRGDAARAFGKAVGIESPWCGAGDGTSGRCSTEQVGEATSAWSRLGPNDDAQIWTTPEFACGASGDAPAAVSVWRDAMHGRRVRGRKGTTAAVVGKMLANYHRARDSKPAGTEQSNATRAAAYARLDHAESEGIPLMFMGWDGASSFTDHPAKVVAEVFQTLLQSQGLVISDEHKPDP
jgi:hypothetical protein